MHGWIGKIIRVDLTNREIQIEDLNERAAYEYIGARGLATKLLCDEVDPKVNAFSPENKLIFATGPLTGTGAPSASRFMVVTKSPLTDGIANASCGGFWGADLKFAGYDAIIFEGAASEPVYIWINDDKIEIRDAAHIWGQKVHKTHEMLKAETDMEAKVACIGPAGENLIRFGCVISEGRAAGRGGVGAVMGSKNLKAIVVKGTGSVTVADNERFYNATVKSFDNVSNEYALDHFGKYGTPGVIALTAARGVLPTKNFQLGQYEKWENISGQALLEKYSKRKKEGVSCYNCPVACGRVSKVTEPGFEGEGHGPEYETVGSFGACCYIDNLAAVVKANFICNDMGMDTITAGLTMSCAMELYEKGYLTKEEVGYDLYFGNAEALVALLEKMGRKEGFGEYLAEGSYRLAERYGHPEFSMSSKKSEFPSYDPRGLQGMGLQYATMNRGGDHIRGEQQDMDLYNVYDWRICTDRGITHVDSFVTEDKPLLVKETQDWFCIIDSSGMCNFMFYLGNIEDDMLALLEAATGVSFKGVEGLMETGERIFNLERMFNFKAGLTMENDSLPPRMTSEPIPDGPCKGQVVKLDEMLPVYYRIRGYDQQGRLKQETIERLNLEFYQ